MSSKIKSKKSKGKSAGDASAPLVELDDDVPTPMAYPPMGDSVVVPSADKAQRSSKTAQHVLDDGHGDADASSDANEAVPRDASGRPMLAFASLRTTLGPLLGVPLDNCVAVSLSASGSSNYAISVTANACHHLAHVLTLSLNQLLPPRDRVLTPRRSDSGSSAYVAICLTFAIGLWTRCKLTRPPTYIQRLLSDCDGATPFVVHLRRLAAAHRAARVFDGRP